MFISTVLPFSFNGINLNKYRIRNVNQKKEILIYRIKISDLLLFDILLFEIVLAFLSD